MMTAFDKYHDFAARLLGREDFPLPLPEWDRNYPHNVGLLSDAEEAELAAKVLNNTQGMSLESWRKLELEQRLPWLRFAVEKIGLGANEGQITKADILSSLMDRARAKSPIVEANEVKKWPNGILETLIADGTLSSMENAKSIACDACGSDHIETVQYIQSPTKSGLRAYISCPENGRILIPLDRLRRWSINMSIVAFEPEAASVEEVIVSERVWPDPSAHTTAKVWTRKDGVICLSTKTDSAHDGRVEFPPTPSGDLTYQMRFVQFMCFKHPATATLAEVIAQVYPEEYASVSTDAAGLKNILRKLRSLVSDVRMKKLAKAGLNPDILPPLSVEVSLEVGIGLRLAHLHRLDDKELDQADES